MLPGQLKNRITRSLNRRPLRDALKASGYLVAITALGASNADAAVMVADGLGEVLVSTPFGDPDATAMAYFAGAFDAVSTVGMGAAQRVLHLGGSLPMGLAAGLSQIAEQSTLGFDEIRTGFESLAQRSSELGAIWRTTTSNAVTNTGSFLSNLIPDSPQEAIEGFKNLAVKTVELFGVLKGLQETYKWAISAIRKKASTEPAVANIVESTALQPPAATNLTINITLAGGEVAKSAEKRLMEIAASPDAGAILSDPARLQEAITEGACTCQQDTSSVDMAGNLATWKDQGDEVVTRAACTASCATVTARLKSMMDRIPPIRVSSNENFACPAL